MPTPLPDLLAQVAFLNAPDAPFHYEVVGATIAGTLDESYSIVVDFDEAKGTYDFEETKHRAENSIGKEFCFEAGGIYNKAKEGIAPYLGYERIKTPLFDFLEANGWKRKKGFFVG